MPELGKITSPRARRLVALVLIGCLMILFLSGFDMIKAKVRDIKRRADIRVLSEALNLYHDTFGRYPDSTDDWQGWDLSMGYNNGQPQFISQLEEAGLIDRAVGDPINNAAYHYRYQKFQPGDYGCKNAFYILQIANFELPTKDNGRGECPELNWVEFSPNGYTIQNWD